MSWYDLFLYSKCLIKEKYEIVFKYLQVTNQASKFVTLLMHASTFKLSMTYYRTFLEIACQLPTYNQSREH